MKNFNWEDFKNGKIAVHCDTKEKARYFLKKCKEKGFIWNDESDISPNDYSWASYKEETTYSMGEKGIMFGDIDVHENENLKIIKWGIDTMKELRFKEVIANIKEGQVWESNIKEIYKRADESIIIANKNGVKTDSMIFLEKATYRLQRKENSFVEAFAAYEEGKEIESKYCKTRYKKKEGEMHYYSNMHGCWIRSEVGFTPDSIRDKWYIND